MTDAKQDCMDEKALFAAADEAALATASAVISMGGIFLSYAVPGMWPLALFCGAFGVITAMKADRAGKARRLALKQRAGR